MKIFINTTNWAIVKTENEFPSVVGDNYVDTLKVYYDVNPSTALIYPTITLLKPNGRKVGAFPFDAGTVENPVPFTYTDADSNTWYGFTFTLSSDDGQLTSVGRYQVTITTNKYKVVGTAPNESQVITNQRNTNIQLEVMNAVLNDNSDILILGESVDDVVASMYQLCQTLELDFATLTNSKADRSNTDQTILADKIQTRLVEPKALTSTLTLGYGGATITTKNGTNSDSYVNVNSDDLVSVSSDTKVKLGVNSYATKVEITNGNTEINSTNVDIKSSTTNVGVQTGDYWKFNGGTLSLKGGSHTIESNSKKSTVAIGDTEINSKVVDSLDNTKYSELRQLKQDLMYNVINGNKTTNLKIGDSKVDFELYDNSYSYESYFLFRPESVGATHYGSGGSSGFGLETDKVSMRCFKNGVGQHELLISHGDTGIPAGLVHKELISSSNTTTYSLIIDTANAAEQLFLNNTERNNIIAEIEEVFA